MSKVINVSDDVYKKMKLMKGIHSYSELIRELISNKGNKDRLLSFKGRDFIDERKIEELRKSWGKWTEKYV